MKKLVVSFFLTSILCFSQYSFSALELIDDFSTEIFDCSKWSFGSAEGGITHNSTDNDVDIVLKPYSSSEGICRNRLRPNNGSAITSLSADVKINAINHVAAMEYTEVRIYGNFFNTKGGQTVAGDVEPIIRFGDRGMGLEAWWTIIETQDAYYQELIVEEGSIIPPGTLTTGTYYPMSLSYDGQETFTFSFNGTTVQHTWKNERNAAATESYFKEIQARVGITSSLTDVTGANDLSVSIDNVMANGASYDTFTGSLDASKWREGLQSVTTDTTNGELDTHVEAANSPTGNTDTRVFISGEKSLTSSAKMSARLNSVTLGTYGRVRISGLWYNAIKTEGQYNGNEGNVYAQIVLRRRIDGTYSVFYYLEYVIDKDWINAHELKFENFAMSIFPNIDYELSITRTATTMEFKVDNGTTSETKTFNTTAPFTYEYPPGNFVTVTPNPRKVTPGLGGKGFATQIRNSAGSIDASIDDVYIEEVVVGDEDTAASPNIVAGLSGIDSAVTIGATAELGEPFHGDIGDSGTPEKSVWFEWIAPGDGEVIFDTAGSTFDTLLSIYDPVGAPAPITGASSSALVGPDFTQYLKLDGNNNKNGDVTYSQVSTEVERGKTYKIAVDGNNSEEGLVILNYSLAIANDDSMCIPVKTASNKITLICL